MDVPQIMRAALVPEPGGPDVFRIDQVETPTPRDGEVLIKVAAAALNYADLLERSGDYPGWAPRPTSVMGLEVSGTIAALGPGTSRFQVGDPVCALLSGGGYAEYCTVPELQVLPVPDGLDMVQAASLPEAFCTVWTNMIDRGRLTSGERVLIHGGTSGIGSTAINLARAWGAEVFATAGTDEKCARCKEMGAALAINYRTQDFVEEVNAATAGEGVDVVLDMVAGSYFARDLEILRMEGRLICVGTQGGWDTSFSVAPLLLKRITLTGSTLRSRSPEEKRQILQALEERVWPLLGDGTIKPVVDSTFDLEDVAEAHRRLESHVHVGKIVLTM
ncbi:MAG: NAD(P)H-quinone oxidoreductase [Alphaproteobacteria bacterium]